MRQKLITAVAFVFLVVVGFFAAVPSAGTFLLWFLETERKEFPLDDAAGRLRETLYQDFRLNLNLAGNGVIQHATSVTQQDGEVDWFFEVHPSSDQLKEIRAKIGAPSEITSHYSRISSSPGWFGGSWPAEELRVWNPGPAETHFRYHFVFTPSDEVLYIHVER